MSRVSDLFLASPYSISIPCLEHKDIQTQHCLYRGEESRYVESLEEDLGSHFTVSHRVEWSLSREDRMLPARVKKDIVSVLSILSRVIIEWNGPTMESSAHDINMPNKLYMIADHIAPFPSLPYMWVRFIRP